MGYTALAFDFCRIFIYMGWHLGSFSLIHYPSVPKSREKVSTPESMTFDPDRWKISRYRFVYLRSILVIRRSHLVHGRGGIIYSLKVIYLCIFWFGRDVGDIECSYTTTGIIISGDRAKIPKC